MGAFDDLIPSATAAKGAFDDLIPPPKQPRNPGGADYARAFGTDAMKSYADTALNLGLVSAAPAVIADRLRSVFTGNMETGAQDVAFGGVVDPLRSAQHYWEPPPDRTFGEKAAGMGGTLASVLNQIFVMPTKGNALPTTMAPAAIEAGLQGAIKAQPTFAQPAGATRALDLSDRGVDAETARHAGAATALTNTAMAALPASVPGNILKRVLTGGAIGAGTAIPAAGVQNVILGDYPKEQQDIFDPESLALQALAGGFFGGAMGGKRVSVDRSGIPETDAARQEAARSAAIEAEIQARSMPYDPPNIPMEVAERLTTTGEPRPVGNEIDAGPFLQDRRIAPAQRVEAAQTAETARQADEATRIPFQPTGLADAVAERLTTTGEPRPVGNEIDAGPFLQDRRIAPAQRVEAAQTAETARQADEATRIPFQPTGLADAVAERLRLTPTEPPPPHPVADLQGQRQEQALARADAVRTPPDYAERKAAEATVEPKYTIQQAIDILTGVTRPKGETEGDVKAALGEHAQRVADFSRGQVERPMTVGERDVTLQDEARQARQPQGEPNTPQTRRLESNVPGQRAGSDAQLQGEGVVREQRPDQQAGRPQADSGGGVQQAKAEPVAPGHPAEKPPKPAQSLNEWIAHNGGLDSSEKQDTVGDTKVSRQHGWDQFGVGKWLFHKNGEKIDALARRAHEEGFLTDAEYNDVDGGVQALRDKIAAEYGGGSGTRKTYRMADADEALRYDEDMQRMADAKEEADRLGLTEPDDPKKLEMVARASEINPDAVERLALKHGDDETGFMRGVERIIDDYESRPETPARGEAPQRAEGDTRPDVALESPSEGKLRADAAAAHKAEADRVAREKAPPPEDFGLTGSDSPQDKARAKGQEELAPPKPEEPKHPNAPKNADERVVGQTYETPKGPLEWTGKGWRVPGEADVQPGVPRATDKASPLHDPVADLVKSQAGALNIGKGRTYDSALARAKEIMRGEREATTADARWFENKAAEMKGAKGAAAALEAIGSEVRKMAKMEAGRLSSNPIDLVLKPIANLIRSLFKTNEHDPVHGLHEDVGKLAETLYGKAKEKGLSGVKDKFMDSAWKIGGFLTLGDASMILTRAKYLHSKALEKVAFMHHTFGNVDEAHDMAFEPEYQTQSRRDEKKIEGAIGHLGSLSTEQWEALGSQMRRRIASANLNEKDRVIVDLLKGTFRRMKEAGVDVGEIPNYFPRTYQNAKVVADPKGFAAAFSKAMQLRGLTKEQADYAAAARLASVQAGDMGIPEIPMMNLNPDTPVANFAKERTIPDKDLFASGLDKYLDNNPVTTLIRYTRAANKRIAFEKRYGGTEYLVNRGSEEKWVTDLRPDEKWTQSRGLKRWRDIVEEMKDEGNGEHVRWLEDVVGNMVGRRPRVEDWVDVGVSVARAATVAELLQRATISSLSEPLNVIHRNASLGITKAVWEAVKMQGSGLRGILESWYPQIQSASREDQLAVAQAIGAVETHTSDKVMAAIMSDIHGPQDEMANTNGGVADATKKILGNLANRSVFLTGLKGWTMQNMADAAVNLGPNVLRQLATMHGGGEDAVAKQEFQRLGVKPEQATEFSAFVKKHGGDLDTILGMQEKGDKMAQKYIDALNTYSEQIVPKPTRASKPYLGKNPVLSLMYALQSYSQEYWYNISKPAVQIAFKNTLSKNLNLGEKAASVGGTMLGAAALYAWNQEVTNVLRDIWSGKSTDEDYDEKQEKAAESPDGFPMVSKKTVRALSQAQFFGLLDQPINALTNVRYGSTPGGALLGPMGERLIAAPLYKGILAAENETDSNAPKRAMVGALYDGFVYPGMVLGAAALKPTRPAVATNFAAQRDEWRRAFIDQFGGEKE